MEPQQVTPTVPPQPVEPTPTHSHKNIKIMTLVFLFLLLAATLVFGYQLTQQKPQDDMLVPPVEPSATEMVDEMSDWKTYRNEQNTVSFQYPSAWSYEMSNRQDPSLPASSINFLENGKIKLNFWKEENVGSKDLTNILKKYAVSVDEKYSDITVAGEKAVKSVYFQDTTTISPLYIEQMVVVKDNNAYFFRWLYPADYNIEEKELYEQILSSFRFVEEKEECMTTDTTEYVIKYIPESKKCSVIVPVDETLNKYYFEYPANWSFKGWIGANAPNNVLSTDQYKLYVTIDFTNFSVKEADKSTTGMLQESIVAQNEKIQIRELKMMGKYEVLKLVTKIEDEYKWRYFIVPSKEKPLLYLFEFTTDSDTYLAKSFRDFESKVEAAVASFDLVEE